jgi:predicted enzyme related to lactoylglutathione lyase
LPKAGEFTEMAHALNWFEIPVSNMDRAKKFYERVFAAELASPEPSVAMWPANWKEGEVGGSLAKRDGFEPSAKGTVVFLNGGADLAEPLGRVERAGGKVTMPKTKIPMGDAGYMALFADTEGNTIGLHSMR